MEREHQFTNHLIHEKSPYLLQHAHNPVNWYPWSEEAFQSAKDQDKPIFLSIGYATCHWCHVMEEEAFQDIECAKLLNETFVCIKVDREELPDVDNLYMEFAQAMIIGSAGWPLNLILTPDLKPFFASTYLPKKSIKGLMGLLELTQKIQELWKSEEKERLISQSEKVLEILRTHVHVHGTEVPDEFLIEETAEILFKIADPLYGGMKGSPKFPLGYHANFLLGYFLKSQDSRALFLVEKTLEMMYRGGIYDHIGGGFSRYSVDEKWHVPHFEKMLYDNALLSSAFLAAWRVTNRPLYKMVCEDLFQYILVNMTSPDGGFYSAEDADSEGIEGFFYTWKKDEILDALGEEKGNLFCEFYGVDEIGNFEDRSVLYMTSSLEEFAAAKHLDAHELASVFTTSRRILLEKRAKRQHPLKDDKILTCWNGLMIHSLAQAGFAFENSTYQEAAVKAAQFIKKHLFKEKMLFRRFREGETRFRASLDDYAFLICGLLSLFETGLGTEWLSWAIELTDIVEENFKAQDGAFYNTDGQDPHILIRKCQFSDGAEPSGNAVHAENLLRLYQITQNKKYLLQAEDIFKGAKRFISAYPLGYCYQLYVLERYYDIKKATIVVSLNNENQFQQDIQKALAHKMLPHYVTIFRKGSDSLLSKLVPSVADQVPVSGKTTLYICHEGVCKKPVSGLEECLQAIQGL